MNKESVGKLFKGNFGTYECVAYSDKPSVVMKNTITNESICVSIDSDYAKTFEVIEEDKGIEEIDVLQKILSKDKIEGLTTEVQDIEKKLNEMIKVINEMREDK